MSQYSLPFKVDSPGSQYSDSASGDVSEPYPTPIAEALESEVVDPPPEFDFHAMTKILASIAGALNDNAEAAMSPTVPINIQQVTSPTTSVICRKPNIRGRGLSIVGDKLARALVEGRKFYHDSDILSTSDRPLHSSGPADNESDSISDVFSEGGTNKHEIPIALDSPRANPMGLIYFTSNDLVNQSPLPFKSTDIIESACPVRVGSGSQHPDSKQSAATGVTEMSTWEEDVEGTFERTLMSLENLARDEYLLDPSKPIGHYYEARLKRMLGAHQRKYPVSVGLLEKS